MAIRKIEIKKLPRGEKYIASYKEIKTFFKDSFDIGLFMTNGNFDWDSSCRTRPQIVGDVVAVTTFSKSNEFRCIRVHKVKSELDIPEAQRILNTIDNWFISAQSRNDLSAHSSLVVTVSGNKINTFEVTWC